ncbi:MAG: type II toxin-antitoxin system RelE/ParE family toxin [Tepidiformaceae bacterium]
MRLSFLRGAIGDGVQAREWYALGQRDRSKEFDEELQRALDRVAQFPRSGAPYLAGTRRVLLRRFPYFVVYRVRGNTVVVLAIAHFSQETGFWMGRPE